MTAGAPHLQAGRDEGARGEQLKKTRAERGIENEAQAIKNFDIAKQLEPSECVQPLQSHSSSFGNSSGGGQRRVKSQPVSHEKGQMCAECNLSLARSSHLINIGDPTSRWHAECFKCAICREPMDQKQSCHVYRDQVICRNDYLRLKRDKQVHCARCRWPISTSDWVRKAASYVYHIACFNCDICLRQLNTGEQFIINTQRQTIAPEPTGAVGSSDKVRLLCRLHFNVDPPNGPLALECNGNKNVCANLREDRRDSESPVGEERQMHDKRHKSFNKQHCSQLIPPSMRQSSPARSTPSLPDQASQTSEGQEEPTAAVTLQQQQQQQQQQLQSQHQQLAAGPSSLCAEFSLDNHRVAMGANVAMNLSSSSSSSASSSSLHTDYLSPMTPTNSSQTSSGLPCKSKRVRTTFTEDQLSILQTHFQIDSNPDGQDLERIATITGLSKRVTQVWFQNSRARQKKYMIKKKPLSGAASLALAASFNMATVVGSPLGSGQQAFRMAPFGHEGGAFGDLEGRDRLECSRVELTRSWQETERQQATTKSSAEDCHASSENYQDGSSTTSDEGRAEPGCMVMDEDSRETHSD